MTKNQTKSSATGIWIFVVKRANSVADIYHIIMSTHAR